MPGFTRALCSFAVASCCLGVTAPAAGAQEAPPERYRNVISANPLGLLLDLFNAEYERTTSATSTMGIGGSTFSATEDSTDNTNRYLNLDVFYRYYPSGTPYQGWNFGVKVGVTSISDEGTYLGYGFDLNRSWLIGPQKRFYVGAGFGLKRLIGAEEKFAQYIPTFRVINIGRAF